MNLKLLSIILGIALITFSVSANAASFECVFNNSTVCNSSFGSIEPTQGIVQFENNAIKMTDSNRLIYTNNAAGQPIIGKQGSIEIDFAPLDWNSQTTIQKMLFYSDGGLNQLSIRVFGDLNAELKQLQETKHYPIAAGKTLHVIIGSIEGMTLQSKKAPYLVKQYNISSFFENNQRHTLRIEWNDSTDTLETFIDNTRQSPLLSIFGLAFDNNSQTFKTPLPSQQKFEFSNTPMTAFSIGSHLEQTTDISGKKTWLSADSLIYSLNISNPLVQEPDLQPPSISTIQPLTNSFSNNKRIEIKAQISDNASGIKASSIIFKLNNTTYTLGETSTGKLSFNNDTNILTFTPKTNLPEGLNTARIEATDNSGNSATKEWNFNIDSTPMNAINNLSIALTNKTISLNWSKPAFEGADLQAYKIYKSTTPLTENTKQDFLLSQTTNNYFTDSAISKNTYYYYVTTLDNAGNESLLSNEARITVEGFVELTTSKTNISMQKGTSQGITLRVFNDTKSRQFIEFFADTDDSNLKAELALNELSLNKNERTSFALNIIALDEVSTGQHTITVTMQYENIETSIQITVNVESNEFIEFYPLQTSFCNSTYTIKVPVDVTNNSNTYQRINLHANNNTLMPSWENSTVYLNSGETETVYLLLHNTPSNNLTGDFDIELRAENYNNETVQKITINLKDCSINPTLNFSLNTEVSSINLTKGEAKRISYRISNLSSSDQYINVSIETALQADYNSLIFVKANTTYFDSAIVKASLFQEPKEYDFKIKAWNSEFSKEKTVKVMLLATHYFEQFASENAFSLMQGNSKTIFIDLKNADFIENFTLSTDTNDSTITTSLSETNFTMQPRSVKRITLTVNAARNSSIGSKTVYLRTSTASTNQKTIPVRIDVTAFPEMPESKTLQVLSFPLEIQLNPEESKELSFILFNPSSSIAITSIEITDLPEGVSFETIEDVIPNLQKKELKGILKAATNAKIGEFTAKIEIKAFENIIKKDLKLKIGQQSFLSSLITGFLSLAESVWLGVIILILIIVMLWLFAKATSNEKPKESWVSEK